MAHVVRSELGDGPAVITLPVLTRIQISDYGLFPGDPAGSGIDHSIDSGLTLIAGINGLGKTTILTAILRTLTGPYDLTGEGLPQSIGVSIPEGPVALRPRHVGFFSQRVADDASSALVTISMLFGTRTCKICRRLSDLSLVTLEQDGRAVELPRSRADREAAFQGWLADLMGLATFIDVLLIIHHVLLFHEDRAGALWDPNAQRQILRALFLEKDDAKRVASLEREVQSADSQARNIRARITATEQELRRKQVEETGSEGVVARFEAEQKILDAELEERERLEKALVQLDDERRRVRLETEKAKIEREEAAGAIEQQKYNALLHLYPSMDETARLVVARILTEAKCLVCEADAPGRRAELEKLVSEGFCPACGSPPSEQERVVPHHKFEQAKLDETIERAKLARQEEISSLARLRETSAAYDATLKKITSLATQIRDRQHRTRGLRARLPSTTTSDDIERTLATLNRQRNNWRAELAEKIGELRSLLASNEKLITEKSSALLDSFSELMEGLLDERVRLVQVEAQPAYTQAIEDHRAGRLKVPAYQAEMTAANRPGLVRRDDPTDVSESQRELMDLAFRLALVKVATQGAPSTFLMETPEASLDGIAMAKVGSALAEYATESGNRLVVTSNLSNAGLISALFGGREDNPAKIAERRRRTLNLLRVASPNRALEQNRKAYESLLDLALSGAVS